MVLIKSKYRPWRPETMVSPGNVQVQRPAQRVGCIALLAGLRCGDNRCRVRFRPIAIGPNDERPGQGQHQPDQRDDRHAAAQRPAPPHTSPGPAGLAREPATPPTMPAGGPKKAKKM